MVPWYVPPIRSAALIIMIYKSQIEPLGVAVHSVANVGNFRSTQSIVVFGCGPVGLLCMAVAKALGATRVIAVDIVPARLEFAKTYSATHTWLPPKPLEGESKMDYSRRNAAAMKEEFGIVESGPGEIDLVVDASGAEVSIQTAIIVAKAGGTFVQVFMHAVCIHTLDRANIALSLEWAPRRCRFQSRPSSRKSLASKAPSVMAWVDSHFISFYRS